MGSVNKSVKKKYTKPTIEVIELTAEERIADPSGNCAACQGRKTCAPGGMHGGGV